MTVNEPKMPPIVQMYDKSYVREYVKIFKGFFSSSEEIVRTDKIKDELILKISCERMPDKILFNDQEVKLTSLNKPI